MKLLIAIEVGMCRKIELKSRQDRVNFLNMLMGTGSAKHMIIEGLWFNCGFGKGTRAFGRVLAVEMEPCNGIMFRVQ
ncbi:MAG: hypothetical protein P8J32_01945, partial [bacterium]|nr:hypothetical protein [bacterium]